MSYVSVMIYTEKMFFPQWEKQSIRIIGDLVNSAGSVLSREVDNLESI